MAFGGILLRCTSSLKKEITWYKTEECNLIRSVQVGIFSKLLSFLLTRSRKFYCIVLFCRPNTQERRSRPSVVGAGPDSSQVPLPPPLPPICLPTLTPSSKKTHQRSRSDATGLIQSSRRVLSAGKSQTILGLSFVTSVLVYLPKM